MAGVNVGTAYVEIIPSAKGFAGKLQAELGGGMESSGKSAGAKASKGFGGSFLGGIKKMIGPAAALVAGIGVADFFKDAVGEARESQKVGALTTSIIKSTGSAAKVTADQVGDLATAISNKTGMDDEAVQSGANMLLTFKNVKNEIGKGSNVFDRATQAAADLSAAGFGNMTDQSKMLGKALNDPIKGITALGRSGVTFSDQQKKQIKTLVESGKTLEAQKIILGEVESQVGGAAEASATAGEKFATAWGNFKEGVGTSLLPVIDKTADFLRTKLLPGVQGVIDIFTKGDFTKEFSQAFHIEEDSKVVDVLFKIRDGFKEIKGGVLAFGAAWKANDGDVTSSGFPGFMEKAANAGRKVFDYLKDVLPKVGDSAKELWPPIKEIAKQLYDAYSSLGVSTWDLFKAALKALPSIIDALAKALSGAAKWMGENKTLVGALVTAFAAGALALKAYHVYLAVVSTATKVYAGVQAILNAVMAANPIGIVILAIAALAAGLIYAYNTSEKFRSYVSTAFSMVKIAALTLAKIAITGFQLMANVWMTVVGVIIDGAANAFGWMPGLGPKLKTAQKAFHTFKDGANDALNKIKNDIEVQIETEQASLRLEALHREFLDKGWTVTAEVNTRMVYAGNGKLVPAPRAHGGPVVAGRPYVVGERRPELFVPDTSGRIIPNAGGAGSGRGMSEADIQRLAVAMSQVQLQVQVSAGQVDRSLGGWR